jgi:threonine aldolase
MPLAAIEACVRDDSNHHFPSSRLLCVENTHNLKGGCVLPMDWLRDSYALAKKHSLLVHTDGARAWHAAAALGLPLAEVLQYTDSASLCLSKGLGSPAGSVLVGPAAFIMRARRLRKALGGGMRQIGVLGACGLAAVRDGYLSGALDEEHRKTRLMAEVLARAPGVAVDMASVQTNLLYFSLAADCLRAGARVEDEHKGASYASQAAPAADDRLTAAEVAAAVRKQGVLIMATGPFTLRAVMNHHVSAEQARRAAEAVVEVVQTLANKQ